MLPLSVYVEKFVPQLLPLWFIGIKDSSDEVRNNSVFGLGEMVLHGKDCVFPYPFYTLESVGIVCNVLVVAQHLCVSYSSLIKVVNILKCFKLSQRPLRRRHMQGH